MPDEAWFNVNMMQKDMNLALELGRQLDIPLRLLLQPMSFSLRPAHGFEEQDFAVMFDVLRSCRGEAMTKKTQGATNSKTVDVEHWLHAYEQMVKIREFEEKANELYLKAIMPGLTHLYSGRRRLRSESAKHCGAGITSPARIVPWTLSCQRRVD